MALLERKRDPSAREVRQFARIWLPAFCLLLAAWSVFRGQSWGAAGILTGLAALGVLVEGLRPQWMRFLFLGWMWAAFPVGWLIAHLLMAAIYFLVLTPIGLIMHLAGRDPLSRDFDRPADTYWTRRDSSHDPSQYFRQF